MHSECQKVEPDWPGAGTVSASSVKSSVPSPSSNKGLYNAHEGLMKKLLFL